MKFNDGEDWKGMMKMVNILARIMDVNNPSRKVKKQTAPPANVYETTVLRNRKTKHEFTLQSANSNRLDPALLRRLRRDIERVEEEKEEAMIEALMRSP